MGKIHAGGPEAQKLARTHLFDSSAGCVCIYHGGQYCPNLMNSVLICPTQFSILFGPKPAKPVGELTLYFDKAANPDQIFLCPFLDNLTVPSPTPLQNPLLCG
jgi:hypothetical protein